LFDTGVNDGVSIDDMSIDDVSIDVDGDTGGVNDMSDGDTGPVDDSVDDSVDKPTLFLRVNKFINLSSLDFFSRGCGCGCGSIFRLVNMSFYYSIIIYKNSHCLFVE
jgi:hypothetical protein